jgi:preprotein translocase subunit SecE
VIPGTKGPGEGISQSITARLGFAAQRNGSKMFERIKQFLREFRIEMKKVTWPSRKEIVASTGVVLVVVLIISFYLGAADLLLSKLLKLMLS